MAWMYLLFAGICEVGFTTFLKMTQNFTKFWPTIGFFTLSLLSFSSLSLSLRDIPLGTSYAVWTGIGAFGTALVGIFYYEESTDLWRLFFLFLLIGSIFGLKLVSDH